MRFDPAQELVKYFIAVATNDAKLNMQRAIVRHCWALSAQKFIEDNNYVHDKEQRQTAIWLCAHFPIHPPENFYTVQEVETEDLYLVQDIVQMLYVLYTNGCNVYSGPFMQSDARVITDLHTSLKTGFDRCSFALRFITDVLNLTPWIENDIDVKVPTTDVHIKLTIAQVKEIERDLNLLDLKKCEALDKKIAGREADAIAAHISAVCGFITGNHFDIRVLAMLRYALIETREKRFRVSL